MTALIALQMVAVLSAGAQGQLFGHTAPSLREHPSRPAGYGPPKPYLPVIRSTPTDNDGSLELGQTVGKTSSEADHDEEAFKYEDGANSALEGSGDDGNGEKSSQAYQGLKNASIQGFRKTVGKNAYGFKHYPKKSRNPLKRSQDKSLDESKPHSEKSWDGLRFAVEKSSDFFSQTDWPDQPLQNSPISFSNADDDHLNGFHPGDFHSHQRDYSADDYTRSGENRTPASADATQGHSIQQDHHSLQDFGKMLNSEAPKSSDFVPTGYSKERGFSTFQNHNEPSGGDSYQVQSDQRGLDPPRDHPDSERDFDSTHLFSESGELDPHQARDDPHDFEAQKPLEISRDFSSSGDFSWSQSFSPPHGFDKGRDFKSARELEAQKDHPASETSSYSDLETLGKPVGEQHDKEDFVFESQRTTHHHREGYNTPKPYKQPPTTHAPRQEEYPLARPVYREGHDRGGVEYRHPQYAPEHYIPPSYGSAKYTPVKYTSGKYTPVEYTSHGYGGKDAYSVPHVGYAGYDGYGGTYGHPAPGVPYTGTALHTNDHRHTSAGYAGGHGGLGYSAGYGTAGYSGGYKSTGYTGGYTDVRYSHGHGSLKGVKLHQITQPIYPDHGTTGYKAGGYGAAGYVASGYAAPGYVSPGYAPDVYAHGYAAAVGYGQNSPGYGAEYGPVYYGDYRLTGQYGGYVSRPYRRADVLSGGKSPQKEASEAAASEQVATVAIEKTE